VTRHGQLLLHHTHVLFYVVIPGVCDVRYADTQVVYLSAACRSRRVQSYL